MKATYIKTRLPSVVNVSRIVTIHDYDVDKDFVFDGESHDFWELVFVSRGSVEISRDGEVITLSEGEVIMHAPNEFHTVRAISSKPRFFVVSFVCNSSAIQGLVRFHAPLDNSLASLISSIITEAKRTFVLEKNDFSSKALIRKSNAVIGGEQLIKTYLEQLMILMIREATQTGEYGLFPSKESMEYHLVERVKGMIEENLSRPFYVNDLCRALGYSRSYLSRLFREETGDTPAHYALCARIKAAKEMIRDGTMNFAEISDMLAFDNPQYFSRSFKRITGVTPTQYKRNLRK